MTSEQKQEIKRAPRSNGPDMLSMEELHRMLNVDDVFHAEFAILSPHLRRLTKAWAVDIPMKIARDENAQDSMTVRDLNLVFDYTQEYLDSFYAGRFYEDFEGPLDGIALILKKHGINPARAAFAFSAAFDLAQHQLYFDTRNTNHRVFPAALRCMTKIMVLTVHILNRRDHELNEVTPHRGRRHGE